MQNSYTYGMQVFILHPSSELIIAQKQKELLRLLSSRGTAWFPLFPLWVHTDACDVSQIASLVILRPVIDGADCYFPAEIGMKDGSVRRGRIPAGKKAPAADSADFSAEETDGHGRNDFPLRCRVFRTAEAEFTPCGSCGCSWKVTQSSWVKLKPAI